ncbi:MAG TPA: flagellar biosynthetic protein FliO [Polyangiaceae bacterium]|nr:flagellar biosynthetic protein FliO [Polyangiaceae bacterium]
MSLLRSLFPPSLLVCWVLAFPLLGWSATASALGARALRPSDEEPSPVLVVSSADVTNSVMGPPAPAVAREEETNAEASEPEPAPAPTNSGTPDWLAPPRQADNVVSSPSHIAPWALLFGLAAVGGALWLKKTKTKATVERRFGKAQIHVLAHQRLGPKAQAVAVEFGSRVYLLGVTDESVQRLESFEKDDFMARLEDDNVQAATRANNDADDDPPEAEAARGGAESPFKAYFENNLRRAEVSPAEQLAQSLSDRTSLKSRQKHEIVDIEGQAAGLAARLGGAPGNKKGR